MSVRQYLAYVREVSVSTAMDPLRVSVLREKCETLSPTHVKTVTSVMMKTLASTADVSTLTAASTAAAMLDTFPARTAQAA